MVVAIVFTRVARVDTMPYPPPLWHAEAVAARAGQPIFFRNRSNTVIVFYFYIQDRR